MNNVEITNIYIYIYWVMWIIFVSIVTVMFWICILLVELLLLLCGAVVVVPFVALGYLFYGIYVLQMPSIFVLNKQNWGLCFWVFGAITNIVGNCILIPSFGFVVAAYSTAISYFVMMGLLYGCNLYTDWIYA